MNGLNLLAWLTQLGLSVATPLAMFTLGALWLRQRFDLGIWVLWAGIGIGFYCAVDGFRRCLKTLDRLSRDKKKSDEPPPISFNDHI